MSKYKQTYWNDIKCPFFYSDKENTISCEGVKKNSTNRQIFKTTKDRQIWESRYCCSIEACKKCPIYKVADEKYK